MNKKDKEEFEKKNNKKCKKISWTKSFFSLVVVGYFIYNFTFNMNYTLNNIEEYFFYIVDSVKNIINLVR